IYYTIDGSDPTEDSTKYTDPFTLEGGDVTVKAIATHEGMLTSKIATREYHVWDPYCNVIDNSHDTPNKGEYRQHTCTVDGVDYAMLGIHHASQGIQMNNNATRTCYIIQTGDNVGYVLKSIEVDFNSNTNNIEFIVRGSNTPFSDGVAEGSAPNNIKTNGVVIGTISKDNPSVEFDRDYDYFAFYPAKNGVVYMNSVTVNYRDMKALDMNEAPVIPDNFADHFLFDESNWLTGELPTHTDWTAMYQYNDNDPIEADTTGILEDLTPASLHTLKIWYEHYYHDAKTEEKVFQHVSAPKYSITLAENTDLDFTNKIGEGVTVYFTLNGNEPEAAAANEPANAPAKKVLRAATENSVYTLDSEDDLNATHAITSEISHVVITPAVKEKMANDLKVMAVHESTGLKSAVTTSPLSDVTTGVEAIEAADADAVYFNLQGVKVTNPAPGAYIRIIDGKATKVLVK
ncbi:MAG: chitobiase/beta-hexosaminidase C-terminal domain-containing protein, partial [Muribaculaceae bacterium]|nr:chitobiase/beta-hexosaminidase C-terminal domain-containing protein [Muribaculaceae bacterium]